MVITQAFAANHKEGRVEGQSSRWSQTFTQPSKPPLINISLVVAPGACKLKERT
jgi:hypothetical protein